MPVCVVNDCTSTCSQSFEMAMNVVLFRTVSRCMLSRFALLTDGGCSDSLLGIMQFGKGSISNHAVL